MASYYKKIKGVRYDRALLDVAESSVKGRGDGRISLADARRLMKLVKDAGTYTDVEKRTIRYIRDKFKFASEADRWFRDELKKWLASQKETPKSAPKAARAPVKKAALRPARGKAAAKPKKAAPAKKAAAKPKKAPPVKKAPAKPRKVEKPKPESLIDREMARMERERAARAKVEREMPPPGKREEPKRSFLGAAIVVIVVIIIILIIALWPKRKKPAEDIAKSTAPSEDVGKKEEVVKEEAAVDEGKYYTVQVKDSLVKISESLSGDYRNWKKIFDANRDTIKDPTLIYPGQKLLIPESVKTKE